MRVLLFSIVAICIAGSRTQEITLGTEYLRAHINDSLSSGSVINAQLEDVQPNGPVAVDADPSPSPSTTDSTTTTAAAIVAASDDKDDSPEDVSEAKSSKKHYHHHISDHEHDTTISLDFHNILDAFKHAVLESEKRIIAAQNAQASVSAAAAAPAVVVKSYRVAARGQ